MVRMLYCAPLAVATILSAPVLGQQPVERCPAVSVSETLSGYRPLSTLGIEAVGAQELQVFKVWRLGTCGSQVSFYDGRLVMKSGESFVALADVGGVRFVRRPRTVEPGLVRRDLGAIGSGRLLMAYRVDERGEGADRQDRFIGVWQTGPVFEVRGFTMRGGVQVGVIRPILRSRTPIRSVGYAPMPDAAAGMMYLVLSMDGETAIASMNWNHPDFFGTGA